ncbi:MAG: NtaA/DmoA family FMN-dependent monooxygenase [Gordonia sp. (in: high G+C Gram-positive bacteria)]
MFHLGWFMGLGFGVYGWNQMWSGNVPADVGRPELFIDAARSLERAGFDYIMLEDSSVLPDVYGGDFAHSVKTGIIRFDPIPLVPLLTRATKSIGVIATINTTFYPPFLAARIMSSLDHITRGRVGINLVTGSPHAAAQNYGLDKLPEHDLRYDMAADWMRAVRALWDSWDDDALVADENTGVYVRGGSVRPVHYEGRYYRTRGPLNTLPGPQRHPVVCQAGGSSAGRDLAAEHADTVVSAVVGVEAMKAFRDDMHNRVKRFGRDPAELKILFLIDPVLADTDEAAREIAKSRHNLDESGLADALAGMSYLSGVDFSKYDLDQPLPDFESNGHQSTVADFKRASQGKTLRELVNSRRVSESVDLVGTPESVAGQMEAAMSFAGGDGFLIASPVTRRNVTLIADGLCPALARRGLIRSSYSESTLRSNLTAF